MTGDVSSSAAPQLPVAILTITAGSCRVEYTVSLIQSQRAWLQYLPVSSGPYLDMGRNEAIRKFYTQCPDAEFALFIDTDIQFTEADIRAVVEAAYRYQADTKVWPVIGGLYQGIVAGGRHRNLIAYRLRNDDGEGQKFYPVSVEEYEETFAENPEALLEVDGIGTGFMLIHRDILDEMEKVFDAPQEWFYEGVINGQWFGEDLIFCLRAKSLGHPILAHPAVRLTHYKEVGLSFASPDPEPEE